MKNEMNIVLNVLDEYLLKGNVHKEVLAMCLARISASRYSSHLRFTGLSDGVPEDETLAYESLLRLRLLFQDYSKPTEDFLNLLIEVGRLYRLTTNFIHDSGQVEEFRVAYMRIVRSRLNEQIDCIVKPLTYTLSFATAPNDDPLRKDILEVVGMCIKTRNQLESYWHSIFGYL